MKLNTNNAILYDKIIKSIEEDNAKDFIENVNLFMPYFLELRNKAEYNANEMRDCFCRKLNAKMPQDFQNGLPVFLHGETFYWNIGEKIEAGDYLQYDENRGKFVRYNGKGQDFTARALEAGNENAIILISFHSTKVDSDIGQQVIDCKVKIRTISNFVGIKGIKVRQKL